MHQNQNPIRTMRDRVGITQIQLSLRARVSLSTIRNAERGLATKATFRKIARALGVGVDELTGRKEVAQ